MSKFIQNWTYPKHAAAVTGIYTVIAMIGNTLLGKKIPEDERSLCPAEICRHMTKKQWIFNGIAVGCYAFDMSATYFILKHFKKQYK